MRKFDITKPHYHECVGCHREDYCANLKCELPQKFECIHCVRGDELLTQAGMPYWKINRPATLSEYDNDD